MKVFTEYWGPIALGLAVVWAIIKWAFGVDEKQELQSARLKDHDDTLAKHDTRITKLEDGHGN